MSNVLEQIIEKPEEQGEQGQKSRRLPIGIGGERLKEDRKTLPAVEVRNQVSWVNRNMNLPFNLTVGESSPLGVFLTPDPEEGEKVYNLEVSDAHTRSGIF